MHSNLHNRPPLLNDYFLQIDPTYDDFKAQMLYLNIDSQNTMFFLFFSVGGGGFDPTYNDFKDVNDGFSLGDCLDIHIWFDFD